MSLWLEPDGLVAVGFGAGVYGLFGLMLWTLVPGPVWAESEHCLLSAIFNYLWRYVNDAVLMKLHRAVRLHYDSRRFSATGGLVGAGF